MQLFRYQHIITISAKSTIPAGIPIANAKVKVDMLLPSLPLCNIVWSPPFCNEEVAVVLVASVFVVDAITDVPVDANCDIPVRVDRPVDVLLATSFAFMFFSSNIPDTGILLHTVTVVVFLNVDVVIMSFGIMFKQLRTILLLLP